jgi:catechol 2,3-dioxygenase-like lactoylglutathione lyase family enzyme
MPNAFALDHLVLVVTDPETTLAWYGRVAGLAAVRVDEWRRGEAPFPSMRVSEDTIIDLVPGLDDPGPRGHLDHICLVVSRSDLDLLSRDAELEVVDEGRRFGARGDATAVYVRDPDGLVVEFRAYDD